MLMLALQAICFALLNAVWFFFGYFLLHCRTQRKAKTVGFFHPYCNAGGGGERVLFCAIKHLLETKRDWQCVIYTGDLMVSKEEILMKCKERFGEGSWPAEAVHDRIEFIPLKYRWLVEAKTWPRATLLGQSIGSVLLCLEAISQCSCDVFIDSMGYAFTLPVARVLAGSSVGTYVHYPTISSDMLDRVREKRPSYNNSESVANSTTISFVKLTYYKLFAWFYGFAGGSFSRVTMVNSTWTKNHIDSLWRIRSILVYPPCLSLQNEEDEEEVDEGYVNVRKQAPKKGGKATSSKSGSKRANDEFDDPFREYDLIISIGQFRPEKDHRLQLQCIAEYKKIEGAKKRKKLRLVMIGSCRNKEDTEFVEELRSFAVSTLRLEEERDFSFALDLSKQELQSYMGRALIGLHTMWNEHFGIGIVEMMQNGCIVIAHNSGGPKSDIIVEGKTGFLASKASEYAQLMDKVVNDMTPKEHRTMQNEAKSSVKRFSEEAFGKGFLDAVLEPLFKNT